MKKKTTDRRTGPLDRALSALSLAGRIPIPGHFRFDPGGLDFWLPILGVPAALAALLGFFGGSLLFRDPLPAAILGLGIQYFAFNLFHFDGLLDSADAFLGPGDPDRRAAILKDPHLGVYAVFTGIFYLVLKLAFIFRLLPYLGCCAPLVLGYPLSGRVAAALVPRLAPPARDDGLGALLRSGSAVRTLLGAVTGLALISFILYILEPLLRIFGSAALPVPDPVRNRAVEAGFSAGIVLISAALPALLVSRIYRQGLGGYTGDALGTAVEGGELAHLALVYLILQWIQG